MRDFHPNSFQMMTERQDFTKLIKHFRNLYGFIWFLGTLSQHYRHLYWFEPCFKAYNFVSVNLKSIKLGQMTTLNIIFHVVMSIYWLVKIWNSLSSQRNFGMANSLTICQTRYEAPNAVWGARLDGNISWRPGRYICGFFRKTILNWGSIKSIATN